MDKRFTEDEAQRIFALASERQQKQAEKDRARLTLADLQEAGEAAGIDPQFIRAAAADLLRPERVPIQRTFLGTPIEIRRTRVIPGRLDDRAWEQLVALLRQEFKHEEAITVMENERQWASNTKDEVGPVKVFVEQEGDGLRVTIERNKSKRVYGQLMGSIGFIAGFLGAFISGLQDGEAENMLIASIFLIAGLLFGIGTLVGYRIQGRKEVDQFDRVLDRAEAVFARPLEAAEPAVSTEQARLSGADRVKQGPRIQLDDSEDASEREPAVLPKNQARDSAG